MDAETPSYRFEYLTLATQHACARPFEMDVATSLGELTNALPLKVLPSGSVTTMSGLGRAASAAALRATAFSSTSFRPLIHSAFACSLKSPPMRSAPTTLPPELLMVRPPSRRPCAPAPDDSPTDIGLSAASFASASLFSKQLAGSILRSGCFHGSMTHVPIAGRQDQD